MPPERRHWAVRGATTVERDDPALVADAVRELLAELEQRNALDRDAIVSAHFTMTADLRSAFPARAARLYGWSEVAMLSTTEIPVPGALPRCIRVLVHLEFAEPRAGVRHAFLRGARDLRPDLPHY
jgi:chorismate mutase